MSGKGLISEERGGEEEEEEGEDGDGDGDGSGEV